MIILLKKLWKVLNARWVICCKCQQSTDLFWPVVLQGYRTIGIGYICDICTDIELNKEVLPMLIKRSFNE
jgi:hypothetical protein